MSGDILIFMPGQEDIEVTCELIAGMFTSRVFIIIAVFGCIKIISVIIER